MKIGWSPIWILRLKGMMTSSKWRILHIYYVYVFSIVSYEDRALLQPPYDYRCQIVPLETTNDNQQVIHLDCNSGQNFDVIRIVNITYICHMHYSLNTFVIGTSCKLFLVIYANLHVMG